MDNIKHKTNKTAYNNTIKSALVLGCLLTVSALYSQDLKKTSESSLNANDTILNQYIQSKGSGIITFDASNIKQFWVEKNVISRNNSIEIFLNHEDTFKSIPLKIQLMNVNEALDCKVEVLSETQDLEFSVLNEKKKILSSSQNEAPFINYARISSVFHMEDTYNDSFSLVFNSKNKDVLSIKRIILSFYENKTSSFLASPGKICYSKDNIISKNATITEISTRSISITGKQSEIRSLKNFLVADNTFSVSATVKNEGSNAITFFTGFAAYAKDRTFLGGHNYPYKDSSKILNVLSSDKDKIIVDTYDEWAKNCYLALDVKENMSDIPYMNLASGRISEIRQLENGTAEIILDRPLSNELKSGSKVKVTGRSGAYIYPSITKIQPGEEKIIQVTIQKDNNSTTYNNKTFSKGVYYVVPLILSYSSDDNDNTVLIKDYSISY